MNTEKNVATSENKQSRAVALTPPADIYESKEGVTVYLDMPGVAKEQLDIDVDQDILSIKGTFDLNTAEGMQPTYMDVRSNVFERRFTLGEELDRDNITAEMNQGVLTIELQKKPHQRRRRIEIK